MSDWPALPLNEWRDTRETLHRWTQIVGKIQMELTPLVNHWWNVTFQVTAHGLRTPLIPYGDRWFDMEFDFIHHMLRIRTNDGAHSDLALKPRTVADFYTGVFTALKSLSIECRIWPMPVELVDEVIPLDQDRQHRSYDPKYVHRFWRILALANAVLSRFRAEFIGKCSPVHFFWGGLDLAVTRFSGRRAPPREGADAMNREAYSHEVSSVGFWAGDKRLELPTFYSYAAPEPPGFRDTAVSPASAYYHATLGGFYLHYDELLRSSDREKTLLDFCRTTYDAAADKGKWDREALERRS